MLFAALWFGLIQIYNILLVSRKGRRKIELTNMVLWKNAFRVPSLVSIKVGRALANPLGMTKEEEHTKCAKEAHLCAIGR